MPATGDFSLSSAAITAGPAVDLQAKKVPAAATFDASFEALIIPQAASAGRKVVFAAGGNNYEWIIPATAAFEAGKNHIYALTLSSTGVEEEAELVAAIGSITPWINDDHSPNGVIETVRVHAGTFLMGSLATEPGRGSDESQHTVTLTQDFLIGKYEITNAQYAAFLNAMGIEGEYDGNDYVAIYGGHTLYYQFDQYELYNNRGVYWDVENSRWSVRDMAYGKHPVVDVTWYGADEFARWAGGSLPTEAQWEYACRAGTTTPFGVGDGNSLYADMANFAGSSPYALPGGTISNYLGGEHPNTYLGTTAQVGSYMPNAWGIYDMHGNAPEWCSDWYGSYDDSGTVTDPVGPASGGLRVLRGGGYNGSMASGCRSAYRYGESPHFCHAYGFRIVFPAQ
jgi:formylglycine-generating enzyme required for sulfatase activity